MGYCSPYDILKVLSATEMALQQLEGSNFLGRATAIAEEVWVNHV
jgi:aspartate aminotransferase-like enzyme